MIDFFKELLSKQYILKKEFLIVEKNKIINFKVSKYGK